MSRFDADFQRTSLDVLLTGHGETGTYTPNGGDAVTGAYFMVRELSESRDSVSHGRQIDRMLEVEVSTARVAKPGEGDTYLDASNDLWTFSHFDERDAAGTHVLIFKRSQSIERTRQNYRNSLS